MTQMAREGDIKSCLSQIPSVFHCRDVTSRSRAGDSGDMGSPFPSTFWLIEHTGVVERNKLQKQDADTWVLSTELHCQTHPSLNLPELLAQLAERTPCSCSESLTSLPCARARAEDTGSRGFISIPFPWVSWSRKEPRWLPRTGSLEMLMGRAGSPARGCVRQMHDPSPTLGSVSDSPPPVPASPACLYGRFESCYLQLFLYLGLI